MHSPVHYDSDEFELLRDTFEFYGFEECWPGEAVVGDKTVYVDAAGYAIDTTDTTNDEASTATKDFITDVIWLLGHVTDSPGGRSTLQTLSSSGSLFNTVLGSERLGDKDEMYKNLNQFAVRADVRRIPDLPLNFLPRTTLLATSDLDFSQITGKYVLKSPNIELGGGIKILSLPGDTPLLSPTLCPNCLLQHYITPPLLLSPYPTSPPKKFSFGVYSHVTLHPFTVSIHDELLVLFASFGYDGAEGGEMRDLTNGLYNQRHNPEYDETSHVVNGTTLREMLGEEGVDYYSTVHGRVREIVAQVMASSIERVRAATGEVAGQPGNAFGYFRHDFMLDAYYNVWLLEVEIVPSTGSIGGVDGMLKRRVMHDTVGMIVKDGDESELSTSEKFERKMERAKRANGQPIDYTPTGRTGVGTGGFECVIPCLDISANGSATERAVWEMMGEGASGPLTKEDGELREWWSAKHPPVPLVRPALNPTVETDVTPPPTLATVTASCNACISNPGYKFCSTVTSVTSTDMTFLAQCVLKSVQCEHGLHPFLNAVGSETGEMCSAVARPVRALVESKIGFNLTMTEAFGSWCERILDEERTGSNFVPAGLSDLRLIPELEDVCKGKSKVLRIGEITDVDAANGALVEFVESGTPCLIRRSSEIATTGAQRWDTASLLEEYRGTDITALVFDGKEMSASSSGIKTVELSFGDFVKHSRDGFETEHETGAIMEKPQLYLLMTSRGISGNAAMNPDVGSMASLLTRVPFSDAWLGVGCTEAWSNVRMGAGYDYPTHIDCFENVLVQLEGRKRVKLYHPDSVAAWRPRVDRKHWPGEGERDEGLLSRTRMNEVVLGEGDSVFIPSMYFHSVHVEEGLEGGTWSVSANRYYYSGEAAEWSRVTNEAKKTRAFKDYEETVEKGMVC